MDRQVKKTPLPPVVFDTDILIWHFRGNLKATRMIQETDYEKRWVSSIIVMELFQGCRNREESIEVQAFVAENISRVIHPSTSISEKALHLVSEFSLSHGLRVIDALIGSSALLHRAVLCTGNDRHFSFIPGLRIRKFVG